MTIPDTIERELTLTASVDRVWAAITEADEIVQWFGSGASVDLRPGGDMTLTFEGYEPSECKVEAVEPKTRFAFWWPPGDQQPLGPDFRLLVDFRLSPTAAGGTVLRVVESGFTALAEAEATHKDHSGGWDHELGELADYLGGFAA